MRITFLDAKTVGNVPNLNIFEEFGNFRPYFATRTEEVSERIYNQDIVISNKVYISRDSIESSPDLKLICVAATGMNNVDYEAARERNIPVKNVENYSTHSVAQHTFALVLSLLNNPAFHDQYVRSGAYSRHDIFTYEGAPYWELQGKRFGIIGLGNIGRKVAEIAGVFGCEVVYYSSSGKDRHDVYQRLELEELLRTSDIVSVHAPLDERTQDLISYHEISIMQKDAILINTSRGGIIHEADLSRAVNDRLIRGAAIDVFSQEPLPEDHPYLLVKHPERLLLTPHIAWASMESRIALMKGVYDNIKQFLMDQ